MQTEQHKPLDLAKKVLSAETISSVRGSQFNLRAWKILDRWAMNSPSKLRTLEQQGQVLLLGRLLEQQTLEHTILLESLDELNSGTTEQEILEMNHVQTELL